MSELSVINGIQISCDEETGITHFTPVEDTKKKEPAVDNRSWWQKLVDWYDGLTVKPYVKKRDLSDPFNDKNYEGGTHSAIEVGIKVDF